MDATSIQTKRMLFDRRLPSLFDIWDTPAILPHQIKTTNNILLRGSTSSAQAAITLNHEKSLSDSVAPSDTFIELETSFFILVGVYIEER